jgi:membrane protease YdiL (CAAX protease family)
VTDWAFETWPRIIVGALTLSTAFAVAHALGRVVTGMDRAIDYATVAAFVLVFGGYLIIALMHRRNPIEGGE